MKGKTTGYTYSEDSDEEIRDNSKVKTTASSPYNQEVNFNKTSPFYRKSKISSKITSRNLFSGNDVEEDNLRKTASFMLNFQNNKRNQAADSFKLDGDSQKTSKKQDQITVPVEKLQEGEAPKKEEATNGFADYFHCAEDKETYSSSEGDFYEKYKKYNQIREQKNTHLRASNNYFGNTNFEGYYKNNSATDSDEESSMEEERIFSSEKAISPKTHQAMKVVVNFMVPESLYATFFIEKDLLKLHKKNKSSSNSESLEKGNQFGKSMIDPETKKNFYLNYVVVDCSSGAMINELIAKSVCAINEEFALLNKKLKLIPDSSSFSLRSSKKSGNPNYELPGKPKYYIFLFLQLLMETLF